MPPNHHDQVRSVSLRINDQPVSLQVAPWVTLLDALRDHLNLTGTKKGCDHGQCGACTVICDGERVLSCLTLAVMKEGAEITTIEGIGSEDSLHPLQQAFIDYDAFQCGYCTPGQICSGVALLEAGHGQTREEIKDLMSGNLCRCGAYNNILDALMAVKEGHYE